MATIEETNAELKRTAFQKKAVVKLSANDVLELAKTYFAEHGYRAMVTGRPGYLLVMGGVCLFLYTRFKKSGWL